MPVARLLVVLVATLHASCHGGSPTAAALAAWLFRPGVYVVTVTGVESISFGGAPALPGCPGISAAGIRPVVTEVTVRREGGAWRGSPRTPEGGSFELRFVPGPLQPGGPGGGPGVSGTAAGLAVSTMTVPPGDHAQDSRVTFGGGSFGPHASLGGGVSIDGGVAGGFAFGDVVFSNSSGVSVPCHSGTVRWFMSIVGP